jgi:hypothetical protein
MPPWVKNGLGWLLGYYLSQISTYGGKISEEKYS